MENASKALIIAGAILLAILIISLGIMILNQAQDTINGSGMSKAEIQAFNAQFTKYEGTRRGSEIRNLVQEVVASNSLPENSANGANRQVTVTMGATTIVTGTTVTNINSIQNTHNYTVTCTYTNGIVSGISF